jgi:polymerase delta-interacting protein 2
MLKPTGMVRWSLCARCFRRCIHVGVSRSQRLIEVGKFETPSVENYQPGQFFLHRVFGYRGVVLFPWMAKVYGREAPSGNAAAWEEDSIVFINKQKGETKPFYSVLIDHRDFPFIQSHPEAITFLGEGNDVSLYSIPGLDYVSHDDVLPYMATGQEPFKHELFSQFLLKSDSTDEGNYTPSGELLAWRDKNHKWLELMEVHTQETSGVRVTVMPFYMGRKELHSGSMGAFFLSATLPKLSVYASNTLLRMYTWKALSLALLLFSVLYHSLVFIIIIHLSLQSASTLN